MANYHHNKRKKQMNEQYGVMLTATQKNGTNKQIALLPELSLSGEVVGVSVWYRETDGKQGKSNVWVYGSPDDDFYENEVLIDGVVAKKIQSAELETLNDAPQTYLARLNRFVRFTDGTPTSLDLLTTASNLADEIASKRSTALFARFDVSFANAEKKTYVERGQGRVIEVKSSFTTADTTDTALAAWATLRKPALNDPDVAEYVERIIWGQPEHTYLDFARENQFPVIINGEAGTGKTTASAYYAASRGLSLAVIECNTMMTEASVQGKYVPSGNGNELVWRNSAFATAATQPSVILLNETTRMPARTNALFLRVLHERELIMDTHHNEVIKLHPDCLIIADANYGYRGTMESDQAFLDRFAVKVEFAYDVELEKHFIPSPSLLELAKEMRRLAETDGSFSTPISTRLLKNFVKIAQGLSMDFAIGNFAHNFPADERSSVEMLFQTYADNISAELGVESVSL
jgi:hypothetical protein